MADTALQEPKNKSIFNKHEVTLLDNSILKLFIGDIGLIEAYLLSTASRSKGNFEDLLIRVERDPGKAENFLSKFYLLYGHKSIGDFVNSAIYFQDVPESLALLLSGIKLGAIMHRSTRYVPTVYRGNDGEYYLNAFRPKILEGSHNGLEEIINKTNNYYDKVAQNFFVFVNEVKEILRDYIPFNSFKEHILSRDKSLEEEQISKRYETTLEKQAFDIVRGILPLGIKTEIGIELNIRTLGSFLPVMNYFLETTSRIGNFTPKLVAYLNEHIKGEKVKLELKNSDDVLGLTYEFIPSIVKVPEGLSQLDDSFFEDNVYLRISGEAINFLKKLIEKGYKSDYLVNSETPLPKLNSILDYIWFNFYGSIGAFRDLRRHRTIEQKPYPLDILNTSIGDYFIVSPIVLETEKLKEFIENELANQIGVYKEYLEIREDVEKETSKGNLNTFFDPLWLLPMYTPINASFMGDLQNMLYMITLRYTKEGNPEYVAFMDGVAKRVNEFLSIYGVKDFIVSRQGDPVMDYSAAWFYPYKRFGRAGEVHRELNTKNE